MTYSLFGKYTLSLNTNPRPRTQALGPNGPTTKTYSDSSWVTRALDLSENLVSGRIAASQNQGPQKVMQGPKYQDPSLYPQIGVYGP